ncbi:MAG: hypothetical protein JXP48_01150 [Acidobacteria bacterium]|nr:hypothetical protein [Acidobacteriota bacterium]
MKRTFREYALENWSLKATATFLALVLWLFVRGEPGPERVLAVPLEVHVPHQMEIVNERPTTVEVTMRGAPFSNMWFGKLLPSCVIDLEGVAEGEHTVALTPEHVKVSKGSGIRVLQVSPARVSIILEKTISREVPVVVPVLESPPEGFEVYGKTLNPPTVLISGPRSRVDSLNDIPTEPISIGGQTQSVRYFVNLNIADRLVRTPARKPVQVDIAIGPRRRTHTVNHVPVAADNKAFSVTPGHLSIQILAPPEVIDKTGASNFRASVRTGALDPSKLPGRVKPAVQVLDDFGGALAIKGITPPEVTVKRGK